MAAWTDIMGGYQAILGPRPAWKPWFAWRPVMTIKGDRIWWKPIYRRLSWVESGYQYGTDFDVLNDPYSHYLQPGDE